VITTATTALLSAGGGISDPAGNSAAHRMKPVEASGIGEETGGLSSARRRCGGLCCVDR
jgi:hypothetical protein